MTLAMTWQKWVAHVAFGMAECVRRGYVSPAQLAKQVLARQELLARVIDPSRWIAEVYVAEDDVKRIRIGARVRTYLHGVHMEAIDGQVDEIDTVPVDKLPFRMLAAHYGGLLVCSLPPTTSAPSSLARRCTG